MFIGTYPKAMNVVIFIPINAEGGGRVNPSAGYATSDFLVLDAGGNAVAAPQLTVINNPGSAVGYAMLIINQNAGPYSEDASYAVLLVSAKTVSDVTPAQSWQWICRTDQAPLRAGVAATSLPFFLHDAEGNGVTGVSSPTIRRRFGSGAWTAAAGSTGWVEVGEGHYDLNPAAADMGASVVRFLVTGNGFLPAANYLLTR